MAHSSRNSRPVEELSQSQPGNENSVRSDQESIFGAVSTPVVRFFRFFNTPLLKWLRPSRQPPSQPSHLAPAQQQFITDAILTSDSQAATDHHPHSTNEHAHSSADIPLPHASIGKEVKPIKTALDSPLSDGSVVSSTCDHNGKSIIGKDGIKLVIPKGAVKEGESVTFSIATGFCGPFVFTSNDRTDVVSPYYWIGVTGSYRFHKPVEVEFEHFAVVTNHLHYRLLTCEDDDESHTMRPIYYDLVFKVQGDMSLCTFQTYHFCSYCLYHMCKKQNANVNRIAAFYLKPANFQFLNHFAVEIWFSFPISYCMRRNQELYTKKNMILDGSHSFKVPFTCDKSNASFFSLSYDHNIDDWCVDHSRSTEIQTTEANFYYYYTDVEDLLAHEESSLFPPRFIVNVIKKPKCTTNLNTNIIVTLHNKAKGKTSKDTTSFKLFVSVFTMKNIEDSTEVSKGTLNFNRLMRCLRSVDTTVDGDLYYFVTCLLPENGIKVIEAMKCSGTSREDKIKKICETFLSEKDASWNKLHRALKEAGFNDSAEVVKSCYLDSD